MHARQVAQRGIVTLARVSNGEPKFAGDEQRRVILGVPDGRRPLVGCTAAPGAGKDFPNSGALVGSQGNGDPVAGSGGVEAVITESGEKTFRPRPSPIPDADAVRPTKRAAAVRQQLALLDDLDPCEPGAPVNLRPKRPRGHAEGNLLQVASPKSADQAPAPAAPPGRQSDHRPVLRDQRCHQADPALDSREFHERPARCQDQFHARRHSCDCLGIHDEALALIHHRAIDVAEERNRGAGTGSGP